jgi:hypothetical protein
MTSALATDPGLSKLFRVFGEARASVIVDEIFAECGFATLTSPDERLRFGAALVRRGGLLEMIGRSIRVQAILHGAQEG